MKINTNYSLKRYNTFGINAQANRFVRIRSVKGVQQIIQEQDPPFFILGGGSNLLLSDKITSLVLKNDIKGIRKIEETEKDCLVSVGGGENWHRFVLWCVENELGGLENLSLIPGTVGAAPIQNIGAYGVELKDVFERLEAVHLETGELHVFRKEDCRFGYRDSVFKQQYKGHFFITKVVFRLRRAGQHQVHISYGAIQNTLSQKGISVPTIKDISDAVIAIRSSKLPDPKVLGNSGSFFKNPVIPKAQFLKLHKKFPDLVFYDLNDGTFKIPAAWLIEQCGWKGKRVGETGCYAKQALVLVNYGKATGTEVYAHAQRVIQSVNDKFGIELSPEVNVM